MKTGAALLLSAVSISAGLAGSQDVGHSSSMGMTWHDGGDTEALSVTTRPQEDGTAVSAVLDRRGTLGVVAMSSGIVMFLAVLFAASALTLGPLRSASGGSSQESAAPSRSRVATGVLDEEDSGANQRSHQAIGQTLAQPDTRTSGLGTVRNDAATPESEPSVVRTGATGT